MNFFTSTPAESDIAVTEVHALLSTRPQMIDVREEHEILRGMVQGARHIPLGQLQDRLDEIDPNVPVIMICHSGGRSGSAQEYLAALGLEALNMTGGMIAWAEAELPTE